MATMALTNFLSTFQSSMSVVQTQTEVYAVNSVAIMASIRLIWFGYEVNTGLKSIGEAGSFLMKACILFWISLHWGIFLGYLQSAPTWFSSIMSSSAQSYLTNPSSLIDKSDTVFSNMFLNIQSLFAATVFGGLSTIAMLIFFLFVLWNFCKLAKEVFKAMMVFYIISAVGPIFIPFLLIDYFEKIAPNIFYAMLKATIWVVVTVILLGVVIDFVDVLTIPSAGISIGAIFTAYITYAVPLYIITDVFKEVRDTAYNVLYGAALSVE
jgi:hypothetical protein